VTGGAANSRYYESGVFRESDDNYITISGFTINGSSGGIAAYPNHGEGIKVAGSTNDAVQNCTVTGISYGFGLIADNVTKVLIQNNIITSTGNSGNAGFEHGIYLSGTSADAVIEGTEIYNNIYLYHWRCGEGGTGLVTSALIKNSTGDTILDNILLDDSANASASPRTESVGP
jgi:hypothetical protein